MDKIESLKKLKKLYDEGLLTKDEFEKMKSEIIGTDISFSDKNSINSESKTNQPNEEDFKVKDTSPTFITKSTFSKNTKIVFYILIAIPLVVYWLYDKGVISFNSNKNQPEYDNLKTYADMEAYINKEVDNLCGTWKKACDYNNPSKKWEEQLYVDGIIENFILSVIPSVVKNNDLPEDYVMKSIDLFEKKLNDCGWSRDRTNWPGQTPSGKVEENTNNENNNLSDANNYIDNSVESKPDKSDETIDKFGNNNIAQVNQNSDVTNDDEDNRVYMKVEQEAYFPGGDAAWNVFLNNTKNANLRKNNGAPEGTYNVIVRFLVDKSGSVSDVVSETKYGFGMEAEAVRVMKASPKWEPARQNGKKVYSYKRQTISF